MRTTRTLAILACLACGVARAEDLPKVEAKELAPPAGLAASLKPLLGKTAYTVVQDGEPVAIYWLRQEVPVTTTEDPVGYDKVPEGEFVGVVEIKKEGLTDFRDQKLPAGIFTMRLGIQPQDGNHMGVAPTPEFLCLVPIAKDPDVKAIAHDDLMKLSKLAANTGHPTVLYLQPFTEKPSLAFPLVNTNADSHIVLNLQTKAKGPDKTIAWPIGIIVIGTTTAG